MAIISIKNCRNCNIPHEWDFEGPTLKELRIIKKLTGLSGMGFAEASEQSDPEALAALLYVLHLRSKITVPFDDIDLDFTDFEMVGEDVEDAEAALEAAKKSSPKTRNGPTKRAASSGK